MSFTIHGIDEELDKRLTVRAREEHISKNRLVKNLLTRAMGLRARDSEDDYTEFLGRWGGADKEAFDRAQEDNERVDRKEW